MRGFKKRFEVPIRGPHLDETTLLSWVFVFTIFFFTKPKSKVKYFSSGTVSPKHTLQPPRSLLPKPTPIGHHRVIFQLSSNQISNFSFYPISDCHATN
jgi:hypothetical protein